MAPEHPTRKFSKGTSAHRKRRMSTMHEKGDAFGPALTVSLPSFAPGPQPEC
jgi:alpha,alpha-trehalose phosphorylase (configuration-retaining)